MAQIDEQLNALWFKPQLHAMAAMLIYAGLWRKELLWLIVEDLETRPHRSRLPMILVQTQIIGGESRQPKMRVNRAVPVSTALQKVLANYPPHASDAGWLFPSQRVLSSKPTARQRRSPRPPPKARSIQAQERTAVAFGFERLAERNAPCLRTSGGFNLNRRRCCADC
jgi:integrase